MQDAKQTSQSSRSPLRITTTTRTAILRQRFSSDEEALTFPRMLLKSRVIHVPKLHTHTFWTVPVAGMRCTRHLGIPMIQSSQPLGVSQPVGCKMHPTTISKPMGHSLPVRQLLSSTQ